MGRMRGMLEKIVKRAGNRLGLYLLKHFDVNEIHVHKSSLVSVLERQNSMVLTRSASLPLLPHKTLTTLTFALNPY